MPMRVSPLIRDMHVIDADRGHPTTLRRARMDAGIEGVAMPRRLLHRPPVVMPGSDQEPSSKAVTSSRLKAGRSSGLRLLTRTQPLAGHTCTSLSTHSAPALVRSVARLGQDVIVLPRTTFAWETEVSTVNVSALSRWLNACTVSPASTVDSSCGVPPALSTACQGSVSSTCSMPSDAVRNAIVFAMPLVYPNGGRPSNPRPGRHNAPCSLKPCVASIASTISYIAPLDHHG